jgi:hypothetical protein
MYGGAKYRTVPVFRNRSSLGADPDLEPALYLNASSDPGCAITPEIKISHFLSNLSMFLLPVQAISYRT